MKLIVGLGNPGTVYNKTRHNIGFYMIDNYTTRKKLDKWKKKMNGLYIETFINEEKIIFLKPQLYMNLSGEVVKKYADFYKIKPEDILVISDDLDLFVGNLKLKEKSSSGGHNGLRNIEENLGSNLFRKLKIGISNNKEMETKDYVLGKLTNSDLEIYRELSLTVDDIIDDFIRMEFSELMNKYNQKNR